MSALSEIEDAIGTAVRTVGPSVAGLGRGWGRGSGVVVGDGLVLTAAHAVREDDLYVRVGGGDPVAATVAGTDLDLDIAVVRADTGGAAPVPWDGDAVAAIRHGTPVIALADPGGRGLRATSGFVSATGRSFRGPRGRRVRGSIEHTAPLPSGSSGGPLVSLAGTLLGLNAIRVEGGLILAAPADAALHARVDALVRGDAPARPRLGVALAPAHAARRMRAAVGLPEIDGLLVRAVEDGSPAARAEVQRGDLLVGMGGRTVSTIDELFEALESSDVGATISLTLVRGTDERTVELTFDREDA